MKKRHEVLFTQLHTYRQETLSLIDGITEQQANIIPNGFNNNIRWNLGHIYLDQYLWIQAVTKEKMTYNDKFNDWFGFGTNPGNFSEETPDLEELKKLLREQPLRIKEVYGERLEEVFEPTEMDMHTVEQVLVRTIFHEGLHASTIQSIKRFFFL
ncbi:DinB family protein [Ornithinibacillus sp. L9]|uniref:DinB family protein n=1 Tax=Ornithinibacillus caprae TaxID=2678566 RepID=A0A6N8FET3_9BACI|nr:DinB family protein [Ornithinibacillus caprae]MUK88060.1 DinB family protein [Ornithinibacillus caprae]